MAERSDQKGARIFDYSLWHLLLVCVAASGAGFWVENLFRLVTKGVLDSRHQLFPFLFAYALAIFVLYAVFGTPQRMRFFGVRLLAAQTKANAALRALSYFLLLFFSIFLGEMGFGLLCERVSGVRFWDYSDIPLHVTRYTSVPTCLLFSLGILLLMRFAFEPLMRRLSRMPLSAARPLAIALCALIFADFLVMSVSLYAFKTLPEYWSIRFPWAD